MEKKKTSIFSSGALKLVFLCILISLLLTATLAWVDSILNAGLEGKNIQVGEVSGLALQFDDEVQADVISINDFLADKTESFYLSECSSVTGIDNFFVRDDTSSTVVSGEEIMYFKEATANVDYIQIGFNVINNNSYEVGVVFDTNFTYITMQEEGVSSDAIRVSLEVDDVTLEDGESELEEKISYIFGTYPESGTEGYTEDDPSSDGFYNTQAIKSIGSTGLIDTFSTTTVNGFSTFTDDTKEALFNLEQNELKAVTVRIWLEGASYACTNVGDDDISGHLFDLGIMFNSFEIGEVDAASAQ